MPEPEASLKIGDLARRTGLTVRTLHHYDALGLLIPSERTGHGHRRYCSADVARLQQIVSLRAVGLSLGAIGALLDDEATDPLYTIEEHLDRLRERIAHEQKLCERLEGIAAHIRSTGTASVEALLDTIRYTTMIDQRYTPEQLAYLKQRADEVGEARIQEVQQEWTDLFAAFDQHREAGADPASPEVQTLAAKAEGLIGEFTGGDAGIREALGNAMNEQPAEAHQAWGITPDLGEYYGRAMSIYHSQRA
ncbi:MAG: MerR family transcriptional regulator [Rhodothermaceae bacterium]|nr:MerR family transcriptional regulator [Rhodothermaceae bacterium]